MHSDDELTTLDASQVFEENSTRLMRNRFWKAHQQMRPSLELSSSNSSAATAITLKRGDDKLKSALNRLRNPFAALPSSEHIPPADDKKINIHRLSSFAQPQEIKQCIEDVSLKRRKIGLKTF